MVSLQTRCLGVIAKNFEKFHFAYTATKDESLQLNLLFLQRKFLDNLAEILLIDKEKTDIYFDFLINEHLSNVDFSWFLRSQHLKSIDGIFCRLPNLRRIRFYEYGDKILNCIAKFCPGIVEINASFSDVTDKGVMHLCETKNGQVSCPELKNIFLTDKVTDKVVEYLVRLLPSLQKIHYNCLPRVLYSIHKSDLFKGHEAQCYNLLELDLRDCQNLPYFTDILKISLSVCPKLESVSCYVSNQEQLNTFNYCSRLKKLTLGFPKMDSSINIDNLLGAIGHNLVYLWISNFTMSASALSVNCPVLEELAILNINFTDTHDIVPLFPSLTTCFLFGYTPPIIKGFRLLSSSSPKLESATFSACLLSSELRNEILNWCRNTSVKEIGFMYLDIEVDFLKNILFTCQSLKRLRIPGCRYDVRNPLEAFENFMKRLTKKPLISFT